MKTNRFAPLLTAFTLFCLVATQAREVTLLLSVGNGPVERLFDSVTVGTNEVAQVTSAYGLCNAGVMNEVAKDGITNRFYNTGCNFVNELVRIAGPAVISTRNAAGPSAQYSGWMTVRIEPEAFPPGQTLILPAGTVGIVHAQSSTNLLEWKDEWVHTFSNTNENRFFRLSAERSSP